MSLTKLTKPRARWQTFKLKVAEAVSRSLYDKLLDQGIHIKDFKSGDNYTKALKDAIAVAKVVGNNPVVNMYGCDDFTMTEGVVVDFPCVIKGHKIAITNGLTGGTLFHVKSSVTFSGIRLLGKKESDETRAFWFDGAANSILEHSAIAFFKEGLWFDNGSYGVTLNKVSVNHCHKRGIYVDVVTSAEHKWNDVYVGLAMPYIDKTCVGIEMFSSEKKDTGGYHWYNVLVVNNYAAGARASKGIFFNGNQEGITPIHMTGGGVDGFRSDIEPDHFALYVNNWAQIKCVNTWFASAFINKADNPQFIGGVCSLGFHLRGSISNPVFLGIRALEGDYAFDIEGATITGLQEGYTVCKSICKQADTWKDLRPLAVVTGSTRSQDAIKITDAGGAGFAYVRINSAGELCVMSQSFTDTIVVRKNGQVLTPKGVVTQSPNGQNWLIKVSDAGVVSAINA